MKARQLIEGATFGPDALKVIGKAFDDAWSEIGSQFDTRQAQLVRLRLARAVLSFATEDGRDSDELKNAALQIMTLHYRNKSDPAGPASAA